VEDFLHPQSNKLGYDGNAENIMGIFMGCGAGFRWPIHSMFCGDYAWYLGSIQGPPSGYHVITFDGSNKKPATVLEPENWRLIHVNTIVTIWLFNIAMENPLQMEVLMGKSSINGPFSMAMLNNQRVMGVLLWFINQLLTGGPHPVPTIQFSVPNQ